MSELSTWYTAQSISNYVSIFINNWDKNLLHLKLFIDYLPIIGPSYNIGYALNLLWLIWHNGSTYSSITNDDNNNNNGNNDNNEIDESEQIKKREKYRSIREHGLMAIVTTLIDIFTICLALACIAYICDCLTRIQTFSFIRQLLIAIIVINLFLLTIGAKILAKQMVINVNQQLEDVNHVGKSVVKSATITATAIERIVETTESTTNIFVQTLQYVWHKFIDITIRIKTYPRRKTLWAIGRMKYYSNQTMSNIKFVIKNYLTFSTLLNMFTFGLSNWLIDEWKMKRK